MILNKALLIKGLAGLTTIAATATPLALNWNKIFKKTTSPDGDKKVTGKDSADQITTVDADTLIANSGLSCSFSNGSNEGTCTSLTANKTINIKHDNNTKKEGIDSISVTGSAKIKIQKETTEGTYNQGVKLTIEGGDITLTGGSGTISKLEEFETYEITEEGTEEEKKYYLTRKEKASSEIRRTLGLPQDCTFPETINSSSNPPCTIASDKIKDINFDGKATSEITNSSSSTLELTITKVENSETTTYPLGYKFSFKTTGSGNITVSTTDTNTPIIFKPNSPVDFKIKKEGNNGLKLEKDLTLNTLLSEVGLSGCTATNQDCTISSDGLNVKQGNSNKEEGKTKQDGSSGKIKLYTGTDATGYENNFKFFIEDGDISFSNSSGTITKLEEFETYEIKKETAENKWYFSRKSNALEEKGRILGLPSGDESCKLPSSNSDTKTCTLDATKLKAIKFEGKGTTEPTIDSSVTAKLKISKATTETDIFTEGYKFILESEKDITIPKEGSENIYIKKNTNTEFKIKKTGNKLTLEKAWTAEALAKKAGIDNCVSGTKECTFSNSTNLNVSLEENEKICDTKISGSDQKMKYEEDQEGYNQGIKFTVENEISLTTENKKICKGDYEIKEEGNKWYLTKHTAVSK